MSSEQYWNNYLSTLCSCPEIDCFLQYQHAGISATDLAKQRPLLTKALVEMTQLERGLIANPDEQRMVGHYWLRASSLAPTPQITRQIDQTLHAIHQFATQILQGKLTGSQGLPFTDLLMIGIGGSALGPQFLAQALQQPTSMVIHFLDNTDPDGIDQTLAHLETRLSSTLVIVISKSGGTAETRNSMLETQHFFRAHQLDFSRQAVAITGVGSKLDQLAKTERWLSTFPMWDWVGGRTSIMSAVGLLPAALLNIDINDFLAGAKSMDQLTRSQSIEHNPAALLAAIWYILGKGHGDRDMVILPYKDRLALFSKYLQQLIMESLGKRYDLDGHVVNQGIVVYGNKGSTDQHAYVQQLRDGLDNFFVTFIEVLEDRQGASIKVDGQHTTGDYLFGFHRGTQAALRESQRPSLTITVSDISPKSVGALIALYERAVGLYASMININAYHQPGVEAGKKAAGAVLDLKNEILTMLAQDQQPFTIEQIAIRLKHSKKALIYEILRHLAANNAVHLQGSWHDPEHLQVKAKT